MKWPWTKQKTVKRVRYPDDYISAIRMYERDKLRALNDEMIRELIENTQTYLEETGNKREFGTTGDMFVVVEEDGSVEVYRLVAEHEEE